MNKNLASNPEEVMRTHRFVTLATAILILGLIACAPQATEDVDESFAHGRPDHGA